MSELKALEELREYVPINYCPKCGRDLKGGA